MLILKSPNHINFPALSPPSATSILHSLPIPKENTNKIRVWKPNQTSEPPFNQQQQKMTSNHQAASSSDDLVTLTLSELSEAEAALAYNGALQTSSAGKPQPTTPQYVPSNNDICTTRQMGGNTGAVCTPSLQAQESIDSTTSVGREDDAAAPPLSRGTTRAVLDKMDSPDFGSELRKRIHREGERRTSLIPVKSAESEEGDVCC